MQTQILQVDGARPNPRTIQTAAGLLREGGLVAFPTETVYGLGANWLNPQAVERLYEVKGRPRNKALTIHVATLDYVNEFAGEINVQARSLMARFWPGPLTLVLPRPGGGTLGFRMPDHPVALALIRAAGVPVVAPSANRAGEPPPVNAEQVKQVFDGAIEGIVDGGPTAVGRESTVLDLSGPHPTILREGALSRAQLGLMKHILCVCTGNSCRSPMAAALLKRLLKDRPEIEVSSAGVLAVPGMPPTESTIAVMQREGIDIRQHRSQPITKEMIESADLVVVMERRQQVLIEELVPQAKGKVKLLLEQAGLPGPEVPDPIGQPLARYEDVLRLLKQAVERIAQLV